MENMFSIIIPFYQEGEALKLCLDRLFNNFNDLGVEIIVSSTSYTKKEEEVLRPYINDKRLKWVKGDREITSIGSTVSQAISSCRYKYVIVLPVDVELTVECLSLFQKSKKETSNYGAFYKEYDSDSFILKTYGYIQNKVRLNIFKNIVWTNCFYIEREFLKSIKIPEDGFMEDVLWSDELKRKGKCQVIPASVNVSIRKYSKDGRVQRIFGNLLIMFLFRLNIVSIKKLKSIYQNGISALLK
ncbi:MAG: glycosyltransferase involved in cell wall biosynthesis [Thermoproteota archaeon]|jgi:glycosyltransferase involved in cell wall biosynthesis